MLCFPDEGDIPVALNYGNIASGLFTEALKLW